MSFLFLYRTANPVFAGFEPASQLELLAKAEAAFRKGRQLKQNPDIARKSFQRAAAIYQRLYRQGVRTADLCRNWGNAAFLSDQLPEAILAWRLGLKLAPNDAQLLENLEYGRDLVEYPPGQLGRPFAVEYPWWMPQWSWQTLLILGLLCYAFTWMMFTRWLTERRLGSLLWTCGAIIMTVGLALSGASLWSLEQKQAQLPIVVIAAERTLHRGNGESYPAHDVIPTVRPGMEARSLFRRGDWRQIEFAGGFVGWVPNSAVLVSEVQ